MTHDTSDAEISCSKVLLLTDIILSDGMFSRRNRQGDRGKLIIKIETFVVKFGDWRLSALAQYSTV